MTLEQMDTIEEQIKALGCDAALMVMSRETAESIVDGKDLTPLFEFAARHGLTLRLNRKAAPGIIYRADVPE